MVTMGTMETTTKDITTTSAAGARAAPGCFAGDLSPVRRAGAQVRRVSSA
jgi:hypothetical protein